jgi:hypothetical protein
MRRRELIFLHSASGDGCNDPASERDRLVGEQRKKYPGTNKVINGQIERRFR